MKILITGGNGYIANSIYKEIQGCYDVTCISRKDFDLTDSVDTKKFFKDKYFDVVIHTAVVGGNRIKTDNALVTDQNLIMYYNLISNSKNFNKFIHFGSGAEIHMSDAPYGLSKRVIRESILLRENCYNIRVYGVFDENELDTRFIKSNIKRYLNKDPMKVQDKKMSFFYMRDLIEVVKYYIDTDSKYLLNEIDCAYDYSTNLIDIAKLINSLDTYTVPIIIDNEKCFDYEANACVPYKLNYIGLHQGIKNVFNKLK